MDLGLKMENLWVLAGTLGGDQNSAGNDSRALFSFEKISDFGTVVFLFLFNKYCLIIK